MLKRGSITFGDYRQEADSSRERSDLSSLLNAEQTFPTPAKRLRQRVLHHCNRFVDYGGCCPIAHGDPHSECTKINCMVIEEEFREGKWVVKRVVKRGLD